MCKGLIKRECYPHVVLDGECHHIELQGAGLACSAGMYCWHVLLACSASIYCWHVVLACIADMYCWHALLAGTAGM